VLVELSGVPTMLEWLNHAMSIEELWERWLESPAVRTFERGHGTAAAFADSMILEFGLPVTAAEFITAFTGWPRGLYPGTIPLLESLARLLYLGCFSNNNELHWGRICDDMGLGPCFDVRFSSHLIRSSETGQGGVRVRGSRVGLRAGADSLSRRYRLNIDGALAVGCRRGAPMDYRRCSPHWRNSHRYSTEWPHLIGSRSLLSRYRPLALTVHRTVGERRYATSAIKVAVVGSSLSHGR